MVIIKELSDLIEEELDGAMVYSDMAHKYKEKDRVISDMFNAISIQEMAHIDMLHAAVAKKIEEYRKEHGEPPADMQAIYDWQHKKHIAKAREIKASQALYSGK